MRRRKLAKRKKVITITSICLLLCLSVGYAAFQTNLSITAKGNIKNKQYTVEDLKAQAVTAGDGLYKDAYEEGRFVYKGTKPNNYITFNNETWRIISIESDNTLKIFKDGLVAFNFFDYLTIGDENYGTYCIKDDPTSVSLDGCNAWSSTANMVGSPSEFINGSISGNVNYDSNALTYLNGTYYNGLTNDKEKIVSHNFSVGSVVSDNDNLAEQINGEKAYQWNGKIGLISASEYIRANSNINACGTLKLVNSNSNTCNITNWMSGKSMNWWTLSPAANSTSELWKVTSSGLERGYSGNTSGARPTLYLTPNLTLTGMGTETNPFTLS